MTMTQPDTAKAEIAAVIENLRRHCTYLRVLGSYPIDRYLRDFVHM